MRLRTPLLLRLEFTYPLENADRVIGQIIKPLQRKMWKCAHGKYTISMVIITEESSSELVKRLQLDNIEAITDFSCNIAPIGAICKHGGMNSLHTALSKAWEEVGQRRHPEYVRQTQRFNPRIERRVEDPESGAICEMLVKPGRPGDKPKNLDRK